MTSEANIARPDATPAAPDRAAAEGDGDRFAAGLQQAAAAAALGLFALSALAGLWLAALLLWPGLGTLAGPLTYGRWVPVHLDLQLYGWCSLPAVGLLLARLLPAGERWLLVARLALAGWTGALLAGAASWLAGDQSGKIFLEWNGPAAWLFFGSQVVLWLVLAGGWIARGRSGVDRIGRRAADFALVVLLAGVPLSLLVAERPGLYPPINPQSGGATGHSLLASTLGIVAIALAAPALLGRKPRRNLHEPAFTLAATYAAHWVAYAMINHGNASHHDLEQVAGLGTLAVWLPLLVWWYRLFHWEETHRRWLLSFGGWAALLLVDGFVLFLPGILEGAKFTNALVAHSHLAMAGLLTSLNMLLLISLAPRTELAAALAGRRSWWWWNAGSLAMVAILTALGVLEGLDPLLVPGGSGVAQLFYAGRLLSGTVMFAAAMPWVAAALAPGLRAAAALARPTAAAAASANES